jgi:hypothetical protein
MPPPRRTYVVSLYEDEPSVVVEAVGREERERLASLDELPARIRRWEAADPAHDHEEHPA